MRKRVICRIL